MRKLSHDLAHRLAAEHALGTLRGRARSRFEAIARADPEVGAILRQWEAAFAPFAERVPAVEPPARVWKQIEARLDGGKPRTSPAARIEGGAWTSVGFWRSFGLVAGGVASVLLAAFLSMTAAPKADPTFVAVLVSQSNEARMTVAMAPDAMRIHNVRPWKSVEEAGRSLELWAVPREGAPRSLGTVPNEPGDFVVKIRADDPRVQGVNAIALSSEPAGGSPKGAPTGPVLCQGMAGRYKKT